MRLHAIARGAADGAPPAVFLHGLFGEARNFGTVMRALAPTRRVLALDLRNHGESPHAPGMEYADLAADVLETLRAENAQPCVLIGHSMGGKVAMLAALAMPSAVARLAIVDIAPVPYPPRFRAIAAAMGTIRLDATLTPARAEAMLEPVVADAALRRFLLRGLRFGPGAPAWRIGLAEIAASLPDIEAWHAPAGAQYDGPALFLCGAQSDYVKDVHRQVIRALFPRAAFAPIAHAGHWVHADNPAGFIAALRQFIAP